jgi:hypothetical protein
MRLQSFRHVALPKRLLIQHLNQLDIESWMNAATLLRSRLGHCSRWCMRQIMNHGCLECAMAHWRGVAAVVHAGLEHE